jgi:hypothetical protein
MKRVMTGAIGELFLFFQFSKDFQNGKFSMYQNKKVPVQTQFKYLCCVTNIRQEEKMENETFKTIFSLLSLSNVEILIFSCAFPY